uniref:Uncharacterized protein n=1 Tax=Arundo donax TaxID=35708 RepID=A0A0A8YU02_ARUDO
MLTLGYKRRIYVQSPMCIYAYA